MSGETIEIPPCSGWELKKLKNLFHYQHLSGRVLQNIDI